MNLRKSQRAWGVSLYSSDSGFGQSLTGFIPLDYGSLYFTSGFQASYHELFYYEVARIKPLDLKIFLT